MSQPKNTNTPMTAPPPYSENRNQGTSSSAPRMHAQTYGSTQQPANVIYIPQGSCSRGGDHAFTTEFTLGGLLCALFFFPIGILCCLCLTEKRCVKCGGRFD
ncbi:hypothetical protein K502DRAFT_362869 [Neoconidiobolus thromboides FSU 785]|nr:hypothetical protein K502DRAFT_362869 [Neoconidiobolus thromboides FSU 785]